jgi:hypothetical protein
MSPDRTVPRLVGSGVLACDASKHKAEKEIAMNICREIRCVSPLPFLILVLIVASPVAAAPAPESGSVVDQQQPTIDDTVGGIAINGEQALAQVVTAGISGSLAAVRLPVACDSGTLTVEIQRVTADVPDGVVWTSEVIPAASLPPFYPAPPSFRNIAFTTPVFFAAGARFAIVLRSSGECGIFQGPPGNPYVGGDGFFDARPNPPGWVRLGDFGPADLPFQTLVDPLLLFVSIDVKPGDSRNPVNPRSNGVIPVAILSADGFDATAIAPHSVRFGAGGAMPANGMAAIDIDGDGRLDLLLHFWTQESGIGCGDTSVSLTGNTYAGQAFQGSDSIVTVGCR